MEANTTGTRNSSFGFDSLTTNIAGNDCSAFGYQALEVSTGDENTAMGSLALASNTTGNDNTAFGYAALNANVTGLTNTAVGNTALLVSTSSANTSVGFASLVAATTGGNNTAVGANAGLVMTTGANNVFIGTSAGNGTAPATTGSSNVLIGVSTSPRFSTSGNNIVIGTNARPLAGGNNTIRLGDTTIARFECNIALAVTSDSRLKKNISYLDTVDATAFVNSLRPAKFDLKVDEDNLPTKRYGFLAQDVESVKSGNSQFTDFGGSEHFVTDDNYTIIYEYFIPILTKAIQEQSQLITDLQNRVTTLENA